MLAKLAKKKRIESYVVTAIPVGTTRAHVAFNVANSDADFIGSAVIAVDVATLAATIIYESDRALIDYVVDADGWQCIMMENCIVEVPPGGEPAVTTRKLPDGLYRMCALGDRRAAICGDSGTAVIYAKGKFTKVTVDTGAKDPKYAENLRSIHFRTPARGYAVGSYGVFLMGDTKKLSPAWTKTNPFAEVENEKRRSPVLAVYETASGAVLLGSDEGPAIVYENKTFSKLGGLPPDSQVFAMVEFKGVEYWSTSDFLLFNRKATKLKKRREAAGGYRMEANDHLMASSCGSFVYFFDGKRWTRVRINPNPKKLAEKLALDW